MAACTCSQILVGLLQKRDNIFFLAFLIEYGLKINHFLIETRQILISIN